MKIKNYILLGLIFYAIYKIIMVKWYSWKEIIDHLCGPDSKFHSVSDSIFDSFDSVPDSKSDSESDSEPDSEPESEPESEVESEPESETKVFKRSKSSSNSKLCKGKYSHKEDKCIACIIKNKCIKLRSLTYKARRWGIKVLNSDGNILDYEVLSKAIKEVENKGVIDKHLTTKKCAEIIGCSRKMILNWINSGLLNAHKSRNGSHFIKQSTLDYFLNSKTYIKYKVSNNGL